MKKYLSSLSIIRLCVLGLFCVATAVALYYGIWTKNPLPHHGIFAGLDDEILHIAAFGALTLLGLFIWSKHLTVLVALFLVGCGIELAQMMNPRRRADLDDVAANVVGIVIGAFVYFAVSYLLKRYRLRNAQSNGNQEIS